MLAGPFHVSLLLAVPALAALGTSLECSANDVAIIEGGASYPSRFCDFYLTHARTRTPFPALTPKRTADACSCLTDSLMTGSYGSPTYPPPTKKPSCNKSCISTVKDSFGNVDAFCHFFLPWASRYNVSPIEGLTVPEVTNACTCIVKEAKFCSSKAMSSLYSDKGVRPFCSSLLASTSTDYATLTGTSTRTIVTDVTITTTSTVVTPLLVIVTDNSTVTEPVVTYCGGGARPQRDKREAAQPAIRDAKPTPSCFSGHPATYLTSACGCLPGFATPTRVTTATKTDYVATVTKHKTKTVTEVVSAYSQSGTETETVTSTTTTEPVGTATPVDYYRVDATSGARDEFVYAIFTNYSLIYNETTAVATCSCNGDDNCVVPAPYSINQTCAGYKDCSQVCANMYATVEHLRSEPATCSGYLYDPDAGECTFFEYPALVPPSSCALPSNTSAIIGGNVEPQQK
ncbi:hypothetical protein ANO11243_049320 [Dothideomycetidae sp. 11243]|nr:hypothetical protein ANO11243_049320 [fungal sp. No.11243]